MQARVVAQDCLLERTQPRRGLESEFLDESVARTPVYIERVGMPPGAVERHHQLEVETLAPRMFGHQPLQLGDHVDVPAKLEVGMQAALQRMQAQLLDPVELDRESPVEGKLGQRLTPPQGKPRGQQITLARSVSGRLRHAFEARGVDLLW